MDLGLAGKACLVAGASRGIGRSIALALAREGADVLAVARGAGDLETISGELAAAGGRHATVVADVATSDGAEVAIATVVEAFGRLDAVVCNVGKSFAREAAAMDDADLTKSLDANLWSAVRVAQRAVPHLTAAGGGSITLISSVYGREAGGAPGYNIAKAAVIAMAKAMARDYAKHGIRVNSVAPGSIVFPGSGWDRRQQADPAVIADMIRRELPFGRFGAPEEVADAVAFVASPRARWISGACLVVDGAQSRSF